MHNVYNNTCMSVARRHDHGVGSQARHTDRQTKYRIENNLILIMSYFALVTCLPILIILKLSE